MSKAKHNIKFDGTLILCTPHSQDISSNKVGTLHLKQGHKKVNNAGMDGLRAKQK